MKIRAWAWIQVVMFLLCILGCQKNIPQPQAKVRSFSNLRINSNQIKAEKVSGKVREEIPSLFVQYEFRGNDLLIECLITGFTYRETDNSDQRVAKMMVWVDGKRYQEVSAAAFIIKDLSVGNHHVKLELIDLNNQTYGISKEFVVNMPKNQ